MREAVLASSLYDETFVLREAFRQNNWQNPFTQLLEEAIHPTSGKSFPSKLMEEAQGFGRSFPKLPEEAFLSIRKKIKHPRRGFSSSQRSIVELLEKASLKMSGYLERSLPFEFLGETFHQSFREKPSIHASMNIIHPSF